MFAGEGPPEQTNRRFHYLAAGMPAKRLSTAFDSVTLYGEDPACAPRHLRQGRQLRRFGMRRLDDAKKLYSGFDLSDPATSVSMTINGPAPMILAFFLNAAIDQAVREVHHAPSGLEAEVETRIDDHLRRPATARSIEGELPDGNDGLGLMLLGVTGDQVLPARRLRAASKPRPCSGCAARSRPTSSRRTRPRTPASSPPSSRCG